MQQKMVQEQVLSPSEAALVIPNSLKGVHLIHQRLSLVIETNVLLIFIDIDPFEIDNSKFSS